MAGKFLKYLPKPTSFSIPNSSKPSVSGPIVSIIPKEARQKKKTKDSAEAFEAQEPTSPKVSCIGQVKHKNNKDKKKKKQQQQMKYHSFNERRLRGRDVNTEEPKQIQKHQSFNERRLEDGEKIEKKPSGISGMFRRKVKPGRPPVAAEAPEVGRMRRYASGREALADFDWRKAEEEEGKILVSHSGPILMGGMVAVEKRKEVNLWKRRTLTDPEPLQVL